MFSARLFPFLCPKVKEIVIVGASFGVLCRQVNEHDVTLTTLVSRREALFEVIVSFTSSQTKVVLKLSAFRIVIDDDATGVGVGPEKQEVGFSSADA